MIDQYKSLSFPEDPFFKTQGFVAEDYIIDGDDPTTKLPLSSYPPILRVLLITDGTVTKTLEAFFWEPVKVSLIDQTERSLPFDLPVLECLTGETIVYRKVALVGERSGNIYALASSVMLPKAIPSPNRDRLMKGEIGIGQLICDQSLSSHRELMKLRRLEVDAASFFNNVAFNSESEQGVIDAVSRTYRISLLGRPSILVTEYFNTALLGER